MLFLKGRSSAESACGAFKQGIKHSRHNDEQNTSTLSKPTGSSFSYLVHAQSKTPRAPATPPPLNLLQMAGGVAAVTLPADIPAVRRSLLHRRFLIRSKCALNSLSSAPNLEYEVGGGDGSGLKLGCERRRGGGASPGLRIRRACMLTTVTVISHHPSAKRKRKLNDVNVLKLERRLRRWTQTGWSSGWRPRCVCVLSELVTH